MRTKPGPRRYALFLLPCLALARPVVAAGPCPDASDPACRADSGWTMCRAPLASPLDRPSPEARLRAELLIEAGSAEYVAGTRAELDEGFEMSRLDQRLQATRGSYDRATGTFRATGDVYYRETGIALTGDAFRLQLDSNAGRIEQARYALVEQHARGRADRAAWDGAGHADLERATYTTCDPGDGSWLLTATRIDLDFDEGLGEAEDAVLRIADVPVFYTPWIQFPIDDRRRSGLLMPSIGNSSDSGFDLALPYYWNIAPNRDATFTPRVMSKRGLQLGTEYRYLYVTDDVRRFIQQGQFDLEVLPDDDIFGDDRVGLRVQHTGRPADHWSLGLDAGYVSDSEYLRDLGGTLAESNANFVTRRGYATYAAGDLGFSAQFDYRQPLVESRPYQALPRLLFDYAPYGEGLLRYGLDAEMVRYDRKEARNGNPEVTGLRLDLQPWFGASAQRPWGFLEPRVALRHTAYRLDDAGPGSDGRPTRTLPVASIDGGLFFDREAFGGTLRQTLEPRLFYLFVPYEDQRGLITNSRGSDVVFDTGLPRFSWNSLFRDNRFSGADRVGDANQLSVAITSRFVDDRNGSERARFDLGQILYFRDRKVTPPRREVDTSTTSPIVARATAYPGYDLSLSGELIWDPDKERTESGSLTVAYRPGARRLARVAYRTSRDTRREIIEQIDAGISWPIGGSWHAVGRWLYSIEASTSLETFVGFEYKSCCWATRLVLRDFVRDVQQPDTRDTAVMLQFELSGLGHLGDDVTGFLRASLPGYTGARP
ncbi:MAG: LPS-assembly protein LptD [Gammaproteobacteria bacterium]|nr:LPS-assembly protein LptD [Gammaproteobacteria bacterium]